MRGIYFALIPGLSLILTIVLKKYILSVIILKYGINSLYIIKQCVNRCRNKNCNIKSLHSLVSAHPRANARRIETLNQLCKRPTMAYDSAAVPGARLRHYPPAYKRNTPISRAKFVFRFCQSHCENFRSSFLRMDLEFN